MNDPVFRLAEQQELAATGTLRWRWVVEENGDTPTVSREEFVAAWIAWAAAHNESHRCFVAVLGGEIVGMAWLAILPRVPSPRALARTSGDLQCVYVLPEHRDAGVGGGLIAAVVAAATELGVERLTVHSSTRGIPAYLRAGFDHNPRLLDVRTAPEPG